MGRELAEWLIAGMDERDCSMVGMMDGEVADWWDECWADGLTGLMVGLRVGWMRGRVVGCLEE